MVELSVDVPLLVVCGARPELLERRSGWGGGKHNAVTLSLSPLSDAETAALISGLARRPLIPADTRRTLLTRAGGNPLYAEQYVRMLVERGDAADLPLPETVQGIIAARIDGLALAEKQVLQDAAVIGKVFWPGAAAAVGERTPADVEACLKTLQRREFVQRSRRSSAASEAEYSFLHVLMRDVAYGEIPRAQRAEKHRRAAGWLTSFGRAEDDAEMVAHHYQSAVELRRTPLSPSTRTWPPRRASPSRRLAPTPSPSAPTTTRPRYYKSALGLALAGSRERARLLLLLGRAQLFLGQFDGTTLAAAAEELIALGENEAAAEAEAALGNACWQPAGVPQRRLRLGGGLVLQGR